MRTYTHTLAPEGACTSPCVHTHTLSPTKVLAARAAFPRIRFEEADILRAGEAGRLLATASFFSALSPPSIGSLMSGGDMDVEGSGSGGAGAAQPARLLSRWSR